MTLRTQHKLINDTHWEKYSNCRDADPELFVAMTRKEAGQALGHDAVWRPDRVERIATALDYCHGCPVWKECVVTRANTTDHYDPQAQIYGRQYVTREEADRRRVRARARYGKPTITRVREIPRPKDV